MLLLLLILFTVFGLAYANGANDSFKGVASLYGSGTCGYWKALGWATATTAAGSIAALFLATALLRGFSGKGLVPDALIQSPPFLLAVAGGAGCTVLLATRLGFPISTTHGLTGALVGAGLAGSSGQVNLAQLGAAFVTPLLLAPLMAVVLGGALYLALRALRSASGIRADTCVCIGGEWIPLPGRFPGAASATTALAVRVDSAANCMRRYHGSFFGIEAGRAVDSLHFLSAGAVSFARGLNDTPKIAALLLATSSLQPRQSLLFVAAAMALGGLLNSRRIAHAMSHKLTDMNPGQGFAANLSTALLVTTASIHGFPVSTTHVSVGSLLGMGAVTKQAKWRTVTPILASWVITLPAAAGIAAAAYFFLRFVV